MKGQAARERGGRGQSIEREDLRVRNRLEKDQSFGAPRAP